MFNFNNFLHPNFHFHTCLTPKFPLPILKLYVPLSIFLPPNFHFSHAALSTQRYEQFRYKTFSSIFKAPTQSVVITRYKGITSVLACEKMHIALFSVRYWVIPALVSKSSTRLKARSCIWRLVLV